MTQLDPMRPMLAIETATSVCAAALMVRGELLAEASEIADRKHSEMLPGLVEAVFLKAGYNYTDAGLIAVSIGPGSFTGLRVGLSFAKGFAQANGGWVVPVGTLEALAHQMLHNIDRGGGHDWTGRICPLLFARKGEVFGQMFAIDGGGVRALDEPFLADIPGLAARITGPTWLGGEGVDRFADELKSALPYEARFVRQICASAVAVARIAIRDWLTVGRVPPSPDGLEPHYLAEFTVRRR